MADFTRMAGQNSGRKNTYKTTVAGAASETIKAPSVPCTISVIPGANTGLVEFTTSPETAIDGATAVWQEWPGGSVSATTNDVLAGPVSAVRFSATGGDVVFEVVS